MDCASKNCAVEVFNRSTRGVYGKSISMRAQTPSPKSLQLGSLKPLCVQITRFCKGSGSWRSDFRDPVGTQPSHGLAVPEHAANLCILISPVLTSPHQKCRWNVPSRHVCHWTWCRHRTSGDPPLSSQNTGYQRTWHQTMASRDAASESPVAVDSRWAKWGR